MSCILLLFPNQLYENLKLDFSVNYIYLVEEHLFFNQYKFHKQKLVFHRSSMKYYQNYLESLGYHVKYVDANSEYSDVRKLIPFLINEESIEVAYFNTTDYLLERRIAKSGSECKINLHKINSQLFINTRSENESFFSGKKRFYHADFYINQRRKLDVLIDAEGKPVGGKWSFDNENRLKYPKGKTPPVVKLPLQNLYFLEAVEYINTNFKTNLGEMPTSIQYPNTHSEAKIWLNEFLKTRFSEFGLYEDAIVHGQNILHHSVLTPMLNVGLISPQDLLYLTLEFANKNIIPLNTLEGFIRQIIGWREYMRAMYEAEGVHLRTKNYWGFKRKIPQ